MGQRIWMYDLAIADVDSVMRITSMAKGYRQLSLKS
jgi:hypothetical protein